jgi:hypothetical protein
MDVDKKLINNVIEESKRLNSQLVDLEEYKLDYSQEEYDEMRSNTLKQLVENANLLVKMTSGNLKACSEYDEAKQRIADTITENYQVKDLLGTFLSKETYYLRVNLSKLKSKFSIGKILIDDYQHELTQLLNAIEKVSELNEEEKKLKEYVNDKAILSKYTIDEGINKDILQNKFKK